MLVVDGKLIVLLRPTITLCVEELDIRLLWREPHRIAASGLWGGIPQLRVSQPVIQPGETERAKREARQEAGLALLPELVRLGDGIVVVRQVVIGQARLGHLVEHEDDEMVHEVFAHPRQVDDALDVQSSELVLGSDARPLQDVGAAVRAAADDDLLGRRQVEGHAVCAHRPHTCGHMFTLHVLEKDLVDVCLCEYDDVVLAVSLGNEVGSCGASPLIHRSRGVSTAVRIFSM